MNNIRICCGSCEYSCRCIDEYACSNKNSNRSGDWVDLKNDVCEDYKPDTSWESL